MTIKLLILIISAFFLHPAESISDAEQVILDKAEQAIYKQFKNENIRFELFVRWIPGSLRSLDGSYIETVKLVGALQKYTSFKVTFTEYGSKKNKEVQLLIQAEQKVPVLLERKNRGETIEETDVQWRWMNIDLTRDNPVHDLKNIQGKTLRRSLTAGQFIDEEDIGASFLVKAGDEIEMVYHQHGLQILLNCESRQDGAEKEKIQIYCKETRKKYQVQITSSGEVLWLKTQ
ncbi:flagellar basal body P-ring formation chaperone FlgA [Gracilimonas sp. Q87]|uniref:flagellar basal body P-ring formation chaperone FlgA n=1 Tax=Gracilimonas sp. Q87 TaxID=3384766 RepID=UPI003983F453